ncbi:MAG TPA: recombinase family protein [Pseudomonadota bacterium]|nr:recombinase family protein [Pseudomonadota bacterium]
MRTHQPPHTAKTAIGYVRVSTQEQATDGVSLDTQRDRLRAYCKINSNKLIDIMADGRDHRSIAGAAFRTSRRHRRSTGVLHICIAGGVHGAGVADGASAGRQRSGGGCRPHADLACHGAHAARQPPADRESVRRRSRAVRCAMPRVVLESLDAHFRNDLTHRKLRPRASDLAGQRHCCHRPPNVANPQ